MDDFLKFAGFYFFGLAESFDKVQVLLFVERAIEIIVPTSTVSGGCVNQITIDRVGFDDRGDGVVEIKMLLAGQCGDCLP